VRRDLAKQFPRGKYRVRTADDAGGSIFLEFLEHVHNPTVASPKNNPFDSHKKNSKNSFIKKVQK
jgi:hypothetical protein